LKSDPFFRPPLTQQELRHEVRTQIAEHVLPRTFEPMIRVIIAIWNRNHMALPELGCMAREECALCPLPRI
jgi:hypothetical protein